MFKIVDGKRQEMTAEEVWEIEEFERNYSAPKEEPSLEQKIDSLLARMDEIEAQQVTLESAVQDLQLSSGGSVKPGGDIPFDPAPKPGGGFKPKPGGGLTIGG